MFDSAKPIQSDAQDLLNRSVYARKLADAILAQTQPDCLVIGLYGTWGSGKTSILNLMENRLKEVALERLPQDLPPIVVKFNPWHYPDQAELVSQFFTCLSTELRVNAYGKLLHKRLSVLLNRLALMSVPLNFIPTYGPAIKVLASIAGGLSTVAAWLGLKVDDLPRVKQRIADVLAKQKQRIVVVIDDIDRLTSAEIMQVFQLVRSLADFPNMIYILAFDKEIVINALNEVQQGKGNSYLEKIVNVPFLMPAISVQTVRAIAGLRIAAKIAETRGVPPSWDSWTTYELLVFHGALQYYFLTIRDVVRFANVFEFNYNYTKGQIATIDVAAITALQVFEPAVVEGLLQQRWLLLGDAGREEKVDLNVDAFTAIARLGSRVSEDILGELLRNVFPRLRALVDPGYTLSRGDVAHWATAGRVCSRKWFDLLFAFSLAKGSLGKTEVSDALGTATTFEGFWNATRSFIDDNRILEFLDHLASYAELRLIPRDHCVNILAALVDLGDFIRENEGDDDYGHYQTSVTLSALIRNLVSTARSDDDREYMIAAAIERSANSLYSVVLAASAAPTSTGIATIVACRKLEYAAKTDKLISHRWSCRILGYWSRVSNLATIQGCLDRIKVNPKLLIGYLRNFLTVSLEQGSDADPREPLFRRTYSMDIRQNQDHFGVDEVAEILSERMAICSPEDGSLIDQSRAVTSSLEALTNEEIRIATVYLEAYYRGRSGDVMHRVEWLKWVKDRKKEKVLFP